MQDLNPALLTESIVLLWGVEKEGIYSRIEASVNYQ